MHIRPGHIPTYGSQSLGTWFSALEDILNIANFVNIMANQPESYKTHFYCALCGGPFAQVFRTQATSAKQEAPSDSGSEFIRLESEEEYLDDAFNIPEEDNCEVPEEAILENMGYAASRHREYRIRASMEGLRRGIMSENRRAAKAYDGCRISARQMRWTRHLRALIHKRAKFIPIGGQEFIGENNSQFLTGRGRIRQVDAWADAFASYEEEGELIAGMGSPYGFQVYQEFGRLDSEFVISSIPFHEQCHDMLVYATEVAVKERGVDIDPVPIDETDNIVWGYLRGLVGISAVAKSLGSGTVSSTLHGFMQGEVITRFGEVDYREAQGSGEGSQWRHDEGLHVSSPNLRMQFSEVILNSNKL